MVGAVAVSASGEQYPSMAQIRRQCSGALSCALLATVLASGVGRSEPPAFAGGDSSSKDVAVAVGDRLLPEATSERLVFGRFVPVGVDDFRNELFSSRPDGTGVKRLTFGHENGFPRWSPRGTRILYIRDGQIWFMRASGRHKHRILRGLNLGGADWAPRAKRIVFVRGDYPTTLLVHSLRTGRSRRLTGDFALPRHPRWSVNGKRILFEASSSLANETRDLYTIRPNGTGLRNLTSTPRVEEFSADWSPGGKRIVYARQAGRACQALHVMRAGGTGDRRIPRTCNGDSPAWSPDGRRIVYSPLDNRFGVSHLVVISLTGTGKRVVGDGWGPDWRP